MFDPVRIRNAPFIPEEVLMLGNHKFWDLGEVHTVRPSKDAMARILLAIVRCRGKIHDTHSLELDSDGEWRHSAAYCAVLFRISLPEGAEVRFQELSGFKITPAPKVGIN